SARSSARPRGSGSRGGAGRRGCGAGAGRSPGQGYAPTMPDRIRVACVQMTSRTDKAANLQTAERLVAQAASTGADVVVLPEKWNGIGDSAFYHDTAEPLDGGESTAAMSAWSR